MSGEPVTPGLTQRRIALATGVELDVTLGGPEDAPAILFLHGFPESARSWRHQLADLARDHRVVAPDQRGYARSSKPPAVEDYAAAKLVADVIALADALGLARFMLVAHDWGAAIGWVVALRHPDRVMRLVIINGPHPLIFQRALIDDPAQRAASQYIRAFRDPGFEAYAEAIGLEAFFDRLFGNFVDPATIGEERATYLDQWSQPGAFTAMLNWYRATPLLVPAVGETVERPAWIDAPFPPIRVPTLVIWGLRDVALTPGQLDGLADLVTDLSIVRLDVGHFVPWEAPEATIRAIRDFVIQAR